MLVGGGGGHSGTEQITTTKEVLSRQKRETVSFKLGT